jgi:hypothetical protein
MDTLIEWLPRSAALLQLLIGLVGFFKPRLFTDQLQIALNSTMAVSEARTVFGGLNLGVALAALLFNNPLVYITLGLAWCFGLLARFYSLLADGAGFRESLPGILLDALLAGLYLSGLFLS